MGNKIDTNIRLNERLNNQITAKIGVNKDPDNVKRFKNLLKTQLLGNSDMNEDKRRKGINTLNKSSVYNSVNKLMNKIYTEASNINMYDSFFVYDIVEREGDKTAVAEFHRQNMFSSIHTKYKEGFNILNISSSSLVKNDDIQIDNYTEENVNTSMDISTHRNGVHVAPNSGHPSQSKTKSPIRKKPLKPPMLNIKMNIKDLIRQEAIESSFSETKKKELHVPPRSRELLNTKKLSTLNLSFTNVNDKSFIEMVDTLSSYNKKIINSSKSPVNKKITIK